MTPYNLPTDYLVELRWGNKNIFFFFFFFTPVDFFTLQCVYNAGSGSGRKTKHSSLFFSSIKTTKEWHL